MASHNFQPPDAPPGVPRRGEFLLQLIQQGSNPDNRSGSGGGGGVSDDRTGGWSSGSAHSSGSFSRGSSLDAGASFGSISSVDPADAALPFLDPAVAALGPSHPLSADPMEAMRNHPQHHHQYRAEWSLPPAPAFGPAFNPSVRHHDVPVVDHGLPSPLDPLFCPTGNQPFRSMKDTVSYPYTQFRCPAYGDHNLYNHPPPPCYTHPGFMGQDMPWSLQAQRIAPADNPLTEKERTMSVQNAMQLPSVRSVRTQPLEQLKKNDLNVSPANASQHEKFMLGGEELLNSSINLPTKGSVVKHGPIGPLKRREEALSWNFAGDVWNPPNQGFPFYHPNATDTRSTFGEPSDTVKNYALQILDETDVKQFHNEALKMGDLKDQIDTTNRHKVETLGKQEEHLGISILNATINMVKTEAQANGRITRIRSSSGLLNGPVIVNSPRNTVDKTTLEHITGAGGERDAKHGLNKPVSELDLGLPEWARKVKVSNPDIATLGRSQEIQKSRDDTKKRRGQAQEWRLKQPSSVNVSQKQSIDMTTPNDFVNKSSLKVPLQEEHSSLPSGTRLDSAPSSAIEESKQALQVLPSAENIEMTKMEPVLNSLKEDGSGGLDDETILGCVGFLELDDDKEKEEENNAGNRVRVSQDVKFDVTQGHGHRVIRSIRQYKRDLLHRNDMEKCTSQLLSIFKTLIPSKDEELRRNQLLSSLDELVSGIWPDARLYLFGSCANAFGVRNSDIDVCLSIGGEISSKSDLVLRLANALRTNKMQNVQALTHARVPIVKFSDPTTGISCDVCINNMLAVVNTKLLHDYAQIDDRLRQLAFMVKHWAKCRQVNETYRGTLSSYAYVLMCIHFLQQRKPPVLPCLQEMEPTYQVTVGDIKCSYYDQVERLKNFGSRNKESLGELLMSFFDYWAFRHDYSHTVISIRTGSFLSKVEKDWTRRIGNERHLICIEDPFEISHDLGRVVDKHSIRVLRDEFQRAAKILRHHANPCVALFDQEE